MKIDPIYKNKDAENKEDLINKINELMGISNNEDLNNKLCIFFATEDSNNKPDWKADYHEMYSWDGFYVNLEKDNGMIPQYPPEEIKSIHDLGKAKHFIWISNKICESENIYFSWVYSHELQHLKQSLNNPFLLIVADLFKDIKKDIYDVPEVDFPTEFDCEKKAKEIAIKIFGEDKCNEYLKSRKTGSTVNDKRHSKLLELNTAINYDVEQEIKKIICTNKDRVKCIQKKWQEQGYTNWNIDIERLCSIKNPHEAIMTSVTRIS